MQAQDIMTVDEMAEILHVKPQTLYDRRWKTTSGCPLFRQGKRLFSIKGDFEKWFKQRARICLKDTQG